MKCAAGVLELPSPNRAQQNTHKWRGILPFGRFFLCGLRFTRSTNGFGPLGRGFSERGWHIFAALVRRLECRQQGSVGLVWCQVQR